jgi:hypothetical protein
MAAPDICYSFTVASEQITENQESITAERRRSAYSSTSQAAYGLDHIPAKTKLAVVVNSLLIPVAALSLPS